MSVLGIIAGGGDLPGADLWINGYPHEIASLGEAGKVMKALRAAGCTDVVLAGKLARPNFSDIKFDTKGVLVAPRIIAAARKGDDALLRAVVETFEREGFHAVGAQDAAPGLLATEGVMGAIKPSAEDENDVAAAFAIVRRMGELDVGQAAVIARIGTLPAHFRGTEKHRKGVLAKAPKPIQDRKTDLPVIGLQTVRNAAGVGLAGIAVEAGGALILGKHAVIEEADRLGLFVVGVAP